MTSREELSAAVEKYLTTRAAEEGDAVIVSGWVLCYETTTYDSDGDTAWAIDYTCGDPGTLAGAVGIVTVAHAKIMRDTVPIRVAGDDA